ncbi:sulfurtransferase [Rugosimonospora acidiphila]|uniref:Sulfurtransferase n=1 Tax=Rugosimonospora acidiphila TaxID=556531 RepID=A0ABP9RPB8_9ACTN
MDNESPLIDVSALAELLTAPAPPSVLDVRWRLGGPPGRRDYLIGHIPGAVFLDLDDQLSGPPGAGGRHPLPEPDRLQRELRAAGVRQEHPVVVYDTGAGDAAARLWWTLRWAGHPDVRVLDGGYAAWTAAGRSVEPGEVSAAPGDFTVAPGKLPVLDAAGAADVARRGVLLDARVEPRYRGETEPVDRVAGHIPGAVNLPAARLSAPDGRLLPVADLRAQFTEAGVLPGGTVGAYCGSGVTAARTVLALTVAGITDPALYVGSWSEWITDPDRPVATS